MPTSYLAMPSMSLLDSCYCPLSDACWNAAAMQVHEISKFMYKKTLHEDVACFAHIKASSQFSGSCWSSRCHAPCLLFVCTDVLQASRLLRLQHCMSGLLAGCQGAVRVLLVLARTIWMLSWVLPLVSTACEWRAVSNQANLDQPAWREAAILQRGVSPQPAMAVDIAKSRPSISWICHWAKLSHSDQLSHRSNVVVKH